MGEMCQKCDSCVNKRDPSNICHGVPKDGTTVYCMRVPRTDENGRQLKALLSYLLDGEVDAKEIYDALGVSSSTYYRRIKEEDYPNAEELRLVAESPRGEKLYGIRPVSGGHRRRGNHDPQTRENVGIDASLRRSTAIVHDSPRNLLQPAPHEGMTRWL